MKDSPSNVDYLGFGRGYDGGNVVIHVHLEDVA
jgi:hypothetical protein